MTVLPESPKNLSRRVQIDPIWLAYGLLVVVTAILLGPSVAGRERLAYRDVSHFYTPLYAHINRREAEQWLPLWNPHDLAGLPIAGETSTALFYPIRRLIFSTFGAAESAMAWYVAVHLLLAGATIHFAARSVRAGPLGCAVAILAYPLAGPIVFLYCNPPFLVGAAWMPLALAGLWRLRHDPSMTGIVATALGLAMPVLGGDPQTTVHAVLIGGFVAAFASARGLMRRRSLGRSILAVASPSVAAVEVAARPIRGTTLARALFASMLASSGAVALAAPQIAASIDWARQSARISHNSRHFDDIYRFSVAPWHWLEFFVPFASGLPFPTHTRISEAFSVGDPMWVATLYVGVIPLVLACGRWLPSWRPRRGGNDRRPFSIRRMDAWDALFPAALLLALGSFGVGRLVAILGLPRAGLGDPVGGPYWLLVTCLPGYDSFRYPAKWLTLVPLAVAIAASRQATNLTPSRLIQMADRAGWFAVINVLPTGLILASIQWVPAQGTLTPIPDRFWGPFDSLGATFLVGASSLVALCVAWATSRFGRCPDVHGGKWLLVWLALDLGIIAWPQVATINRDAERRWIGQLAARVEPAASIDGSRALRTRRGSEWPSWWLSTRDENRMLDVDATSRVTRHGRWHLDAEESLFNSMTTLPPLRLINFWEAAAAALRETPRVEATTFWNRTMDWLAIDTQWIIDHRPGDGADRQTPWTPVHRNASPLLWTPTYLSVAPMVGSLREPIAARLREIAKDEPDGVPIVEDPTRSHSSPAVARENAESATEIENDDSDNAAWLSIEYDSPESISIQCHASGPGLIILKQFQDGNWRAYREVDADGSSRVRMPVLRADYLFSGIVLPAGQHTITLEYHPWWLAVSLWVSAIGWGSIVSWVAFASWRRRVPPK